MMILGIVLHAGNLYLAAPPPQFPFPTDRNTSLVFDLLFHFIHAFRMPTFFLLAGFFAALLVEKRGLEGTLRNRAARILAPLAVACVTILPLTLVLMLDFAIGARSGVYALWPERPLVEDLERSLAAAGHPVGQLPAGHLWFLVYLVYFYLLLPVCIVLARAVRRNAARLQAPFASPWMLLPLGLVTALTLLPYRGAQVLEGFIYFRPHWPSLLYYGAFFAFGYLVRELPAFLEAARRRAGAFALAAAALFPLALWASHLEYAAAAPGGPRLLGAALANGLATWALVYGFVGCAMRYFDRPAPWVLYASQSSYWVFLVHMPLVGLAGWWLLRYDLPAELKFAAVVAFVSAASFLSYHHAVQRTWVSAFLNGRRFDLAWPWRAR